MGLVRVGTVTGLDNKARIMVEYYLRAGFQKMKELWCRYLFRISACMLCGYFYNSAPERFWRQHKGSVDKVHSPSSSTASYGSLILFSSFVSSYKVPLFPSLHPPPPKT
jgi:hypothetical protein